MNSSTISNESEFQLKIYNDPKMQHYIIDSLQDSDLLKSINELKFTREVEFINGIVSDFTITRKNQLLGTIECKRSNINVTDYVRGIGQTYQYGYFNSHRIVPKKYPNLSYVDNQFYNIYAIPSDFFVSVKFNIGRFSYPKDLKLMEINTDTSFARIITNKELEEYANQDMENKYVLSQYYIRDNRLFEIYMLLIYLNFCKIAGINNLKRSVLEHDVLRQTHTINNRNWRNAFITLSSLGFIDSNNNITQSGIDISSNGYSYFLLTIYKGYIYPFIDELMDIIVSNSNSSNVCNLSRKDIIEFLQNKYQKEVLYLSDSNGRYISSWLNIMRDDFQCIDFQPRSNKRTIRYDIRKFNDQELLSIFTKNEIANKFIDKIRQIIRNN